MANWVTDRVHFMGQKKGQIWMPRGSLVSTMSKRGDRVPESEGTLDEDYAEDDEDTVLVNETQTSGNDANNFGTEEDNTVPTDELGLHEGVSEMEMPPAES